MRALLLSLVSVVVLSACGSVPIERDTSSKIFTQYAVAKFLEKSSDEERAKKAENIRRVVADLESVVSGDEVTIPFLKMKAATEIAKLTDSPADRLLATNLIDVVAAELQARIGDGLLSPESIVKVRDVLAWVRLSVDAVSPPAST